MGAGGFSVPLPRRSWSGRLLVSRQPDQGRRTGLQQRGQLHVTTAPLCYQVTAWLPGHHQIQSLHKHTNTKHTQTVTQQHYYCRHCLNISLKRIKADLQFALGDWGILGRFRYLKCTSDKSEVFSEKKMTHSRHYSWLVLVLFAISDVVFCTVFSFVSPWHGFDFF